MMNDECDDVMMMMMTNTESLETSLFDEILSDQKLFKIDKTAIS